MAHEKARDSLPGLAPIAPDEDVARQVLEIAAMRAENAPPAEDQGEGESNEGPPTDRD